MGIERAENIVSEKSHNYAGLWFSAPQKTTGLPVDELGLLGRDSAPAGKPSGLTVRNGYHGLARVASFFCCLGVLFLASAAAEATDFSSTNFKVRDPVFEIGGGGEMSSTNFKLFGSIGQISVGTSSATTFRISSGFLFFPTVTKPTVTATAGATQVSLSWTAAVGALGWTVSGYNVGQATVAGGPYTFTSSLGNVTSSTRTGLTNGTTYYFVVRAEDAFVNSISTSTEVSSTPVAASQSQTTTTTSSGGGGGGGGLLEAPQATGVKFSGLAYPFADVTLLRDGTVLQTQKANSLGEFAILRTDVTPGIYSFSLFAEDKKGIKSVALSFSITVVKNVTSSVGNIILPPTIDLAKTELQRGDILNVEGYSTRSGKIESVTFSDEIVKTATATVDGLWKVSVDTDPLEDGPHLTKAKAIIADGRASVFSDIKTFRIGKGFPTTRKQCQGSDFNLDGRVNLIDFSIMLFFWKNKNPDNPCANINDDEIVDLVDFSILLFYWSG